MTITVTGPDGSTFNFPAGTSQAEMTRALDQHYGATPEARRNRMSATTALTPPTPRTAWQRLADNAEESFNNSWMVAGWRRGRADAADYGRMTAEEQVQYNRDQGRRIELNPARALGQMSGGFEGIYNAITGTDTLNRTTDAATQNERERRAEFAAVSEADPWHSAGDSAGDKVLHGAAAFTGMLAPALLDPTSYISGGSTTWARIGTQAMIAGGVDVLAQTSDLGLVQDRYNYGQTAVAFGAGAALQGGFEGLSGVLKSRQLRVKQADNPSLRGETINLDQTFKTELDTHDAINVPALSRDDWNTFKPQKLGPTSDLPKSNIPALTEPQPRLNGPKVDGAEGPRMDGPEPKDDPWNGIDWGLAGSPERVKAAMGHLERLRQFVKPEQVEQFVRWLGRETIEVSEDASHWNKDFFDFDKLASDPDSFEELANVMADIFKPMYDAAGDAVQTWKSVRDRQSTFGITISDAIKAHSDITGESGAAAKIHALETIAIQHTDHLMKSIEAVEVKLRDGTISADEIADIATQLQAASMFDAMAAGAKSEIGRALNIMKMSKKRARLVNDIQDQMDALNEAMGGGAGDAAKMADALKNLAEAGKNGGARGLRDELRKVRALGWDDYVSYYMVSGYLSSPATAVRNAIGSVLHATMTIGERYVAAGVTSPVRQALGGGNASLERVTFREANAYLFGIHQSFMDASRAGFKAFRDAQTVTDAANSVGLYNRAVPFEYNANRRTKWKNDGLMKSLPDMLGVGVFGTLRTLGIRPSLGMDEFTKVMTRRMQLNALSVREASYRSARLTGKDAEKVFTRTMNAIQERPTAEALSQARSDFDQAGMKWDSAQAHTYEGDTLLQDAADVFAALDIHEMIDDYARLMTFQNSGPILERFEKAIGSVKLFKALYVPFLRTPVNLVRAGMFDRNPVLAGLMKENRQAFGKYLEAMNGLDNSLTRGGAEADIVMARMAVGVGMMGTAAMLFLNGDLVGKRSPAEEEDGIKSYSIRIGGRWIQYSTLSPVAEQLGMVADMMTVFRDYDLDEDGMAGIAGGILSALVNNIVNKAALQGIGDFFDMLDPAYAASDANRGEMTGKEVAKKVAGSAIPSIVRNYAFSEDPVMREAHGFLEHIKASLPLLSKSVAERRDWLGLPVIRKDKDDGMFEAIVQPTRISERSTDMVRLEVSALADADPELRIASRPARRFNNQKITPREHARVLEIQGQVWRHPATGMNMHEALTELVMSEEYASWGDPQRAATIKKMVSDYGKWSRQAIKRGDYPELTEMVNRTGGAEAAETGLEKGWSETQVDNRARRYGVTADGIDAMADALK